MAPSNSRRGLLLALPRRVPALLVAMLFGATQLTGCASAFALGAAVGGAQAEKAPPPPSCGSVVTALALGMMIDGLLLGTLLVAAGEGLSTGDKFGIGVVAVDTAIGARLTVEACKYDRD